MTNMDEKNVRIFNIAVGIFIIILGILAIIFSDIALLAVLFLLALNLLITGISRLLDIFYEKKLDKYGFTIQLITAILALIIALIIIITIFVNPDFSINFLIILFGIILLIIGIASIVVGSLTEIYPNTYRGYLLVIGIFSFILGLFVMIFPEFGYYLLVFLLSIILLFIGLARVIFGYFKEKG